MGIVAEGMKYIVQDIVSSRDARVAEVKRLKKEANEMLGSFEASHKKMGAQLRSELTDDKAKMRAEVKALRRELTDGKAKMGAEVKAMRSGFQSSHKQMSSVLKKDLAQGEAARKSEIHVMLNDFQREHNQMGTQLRKELADYDRGIKSEVAGMRQETKTDLGEARTAWQELTRGVKKATVEATPEAVKEEVVEAAPVEEATPVEEETPDLEAKLLAAITEHPEGITLTEVAESLGVAPIVFGRTSKKLVDEGRIRKEDRVYFPVTS